MGSRCFFDFLFLFLLSAFIGSAGPVSALELQSVVTGLSSPVYVTSAKEGTNRLFLLERAGIIKVLQPGSTTPTVFLDITSKVLSSGGEQGLLGLAFHPQFAVNRRFFVDYTRKTDGATVVAEYAASVADSNLANTTETVLLTVAQPFTNHNAGMVEFGPDGFLYIALGDGGSGNDPGNRAQNMNELLGKLLRIDVDHPNGPVPYSSASGNPYFGSVPGADEIYVLGLRNPWRFSFDAATGQLYLADVGQNQREEADIITLGGNYGWRVFEGNLCTNLDPPLCSSGSYIAPIFDYSHSGGRCSITGGYVYRGARGAVPLGRYIYADYCTGEILTFDGSTQSLLLDNTFTISSFGEDEASEVYVISYNGGAVYRITTSPPPAPCAYSILPSSNTLSSPGGAGSINVTAGADCRWRSASHVDWITITPPSSGTGNGVLNYSVASNPLTDRVGSITLGGNTFTVNQNGGPVPELSINDVSVTEGNSGTTTATFTVTLSGSSPSDVTVAYQTTNGTATSPSDYTSVNNTLTIPAGNLQGTIPVTVQSDSFYEQNETFSVDLSNPSNATIADSQGIGTIQNDDPVPSLVINNVTVTEGSTGTVSAIFIVSLSQVSGVETKVNYSTAAGTATANVDYVSTSGTLTIPAGSSSGTIPVVVNGDKLYEATEGYSVNLSVPVNATIADSKGNGSINNAKPSMTISDLSKNEGNSGTIDFSFAVNLSFAYSNNSVTVQYATSGGSAVAPVDYTSASGAFTIPQNSTGGNVSVFANGDAFNELNETFNVNLSSAVRATIADNKGVGTILNDDPVPTISINDVSLAEGNSGITDFAFTIQLSAPSGQVVKVNYATAPGTASSSANDFVGIGSTTLSIPAGSNSATVTVAVNGDTTVETNETFLVKLTNPKNATIADSQGLGTILNDD